MFLLLDTFEAEKCFMTVGFQIKNFKKKIPKKSFRNVSEKVLDISPNAVLAIIPHTGIPVEPLFMTVDQTGVSMKFAMHCIEAISFTPFRSLIQGDQLNMAMFL